MSSMKFLSCFQGGRDREEEKAEAPLPVLNLPPFIYQPIANDANIRVFTVSPGQPTDPLVGELPDVALASVRNNYVALSYCWGSEDATREITCNAQALKITPSLEVALCHIRHPTLPVRLWIDQICINQKDNQEKGQQVQFMSLIYRNAARVIIWLGPEDMYTQAAIKMINRLVSTFEWLEKYGNLYGTTDSVPANALVRMTGRKMKANRLPRRTDKDWQALGHLLSRPWFSRVWVVQEAVVATEAVFLWGTYSCPWKTMVDLLHVVRDILPAAMFNSTADDLPANIVLEIERARGALQRGETADPVSLAVRFKNLGSTDPRDKINAFIGFSSNPRAFKYIYHVSPEELFISTAHNAIEHTYRNREGMASFDETEWHPIPFVIQGPAQRTMSLLCSAGLANHSGQYALPSWVPDWSFSEFAPFIWPKFTYPGATRSANVYGSLGMSTVDTQVIRSLPTTNLVNLSWEHYSLDLSSTTIGNSVPNRLVLEGLFVEGIQLSTGSSYPSVTLEDEQSQFGEWFLLADNVACCAYGISGEPLDNKQDQRFSKTLRMDKMELVDSKDFKPLPGPLKFLERRSFRSQMHHQLDVVEYWTALPNARYREFFSTLSNHFGLGPRGTRCGDEIWTFAGLDTPLILRPDGDEYFLIGECYVEDDGVMSWIRDLLPAELGRPIQTQPLENRPALQRVVLK